MDEIRFNRPSVREQVSEETMGNSKKKRNFFSLFKKILKTLGIIAILGIIVSTVFWGEDTFGRILKTKNEAYSAVFLINGQVYFGKMVKNNESEIVLNNVYYVQINEDITKEEINKTLNQTYFNLVKLGNELHGPTDELFINKSQVVFYEYLRGDSKVVEAIKNY